VPANKNAPPPYATWQGCADDDGDECVWSHDDVAFAIQAWLVNATFILGWVSLTGAHGSRHLSDSSTGSAGASRKNRDDDDDQEWVDVGGHIEHDRRASTPTYGGTDGGDGQLPTCLFALDALLLPSTAGIERMYSRAPRHYRCVSLGHMIVLLSATRCNTYL
jgi:hypothetical protein